MTTDNDSTASRFLKEKGMCPVRGPYEFTYAKLKEFIEDFASVKRIESIKRKRSAHILMGDPLNHPAWYRNQSK